MNTARIAELLEPFIGIRPNSTARPNSAARPNSRPKSDAIPSHCHSEPAKAGEACPEPGRREPAVLSPAQLQRISTYIDILIR